MAKALHSEDSMPELAFADILPGARFSELHSRTINRPISEVWPQALAVTARDVRTLGPLLAARGLPSLLTGRRPPLAMAKQPLLDVFVGLGFVQLRRDVHPDDGRAVVILGAAGQFWKVAHNAPLRFADGQDFLDFSTPGYAKTVVRLEAFDVEGQTRVQTETLVVGTDLASEKKFAPYWATIRPFSGLIRRSWLAAIDRRATA